MKTAMILAAGRGERLKPLTDHTPKALCVVHGKPLIEHHIINLVKTGHERIIINHAYLGGKIRNYLGNGSQWGVNIHYSPEPPGGLETGGGIVNALPLLGDKPFIAVNADVFTDFDFSQLNPQPDIPIHLVLVRNNSKLNHYGDFGLTSNHYLTNENPHYTFAGIAYYKPELFSNSQHGRFSITSLLRHHAAQRAATAQLHEGIWFDIGSIKRLCAANKN